MVISTMTSTGDLMLRKGITLKKLVIEKAIKEKCLITEKRNLHVTLVL